MSNFRCLSFDEKNHHFCIYHDSDNNICFSYWYELKKHGVRYLNYGDEFCALIEPDMRHLNSRGYVINELEVVKEHNNSKIEANLKQSFDKDNFLTDFKFVEGLPNVYINCSFDEIEIDNKSFPCPIVFINCDFKGNFRLINCQVLGDLWLPNCRFSCHFSLKDSFIKGNLHMEGADFSGLGGASFRGIRANNIYLDLGIDGGNDLFWLNDMEIKGVVSLGGIFQNEVQFLKHQDRNEPTSIMPKIGSIVIGHELYPHDNANKTLINGTLKIDGTEISKEVLIQNTNMQLLLVRGIATERLLIDSSSTGNDLVIQENTLGKLNDEGLCLSIVDSSIGRNLKIANNKLYGKIDLDSSSVGLVTYLEDNSFSIKSSLSLNKFTTSRFLFYPAELLFNKSKFKFFSPKIFGILSERDSRKLGDQYSSLKHWLADAGNLEFEDIAFFHMRSNYHTNKFKRLVMGGIFGWGVRLSNILLSSMIVILCFTFVYFAIEPKESISTYFALSTQSFISSFFGKWQDYQPNGLLANFVTFESYIGILFITVFVGAYIRKLLR